MCIKSIRTFGESFEDDVGASLTEGDLGAEAIVGVRGGPEAEEEGERGTTLLFSCESSESECELAPPCNERNCVQFISFLNKIDYSLEKTLEKTKRALAAQHEKPFHIP